MLQLLILLFFQFSRLFHKTTLNIILHGRRLSVNEPKRLDKFMSSVQKRVTNEQNSEPHSAASTRIVESSNPSWSQTSGSVVVSKTISESISSERRKRKNKSYRLYDYVRKHVDDSLGVTHLESSSERRKLVKKQLTFSTRLESTNNEKSKIKGNERKWMKNGLSPYEHEILKSSSKRRKTIKKLPVFNLLNSSTFMRKDGKSFTISARKGGRQRLRQVTRLGFTRY